MLKSLFVRGLVEFNRVFDHAWRYVMGVPTLSRSQVTAHIYLGGQFGRAAVRKFKEMGITGVVSMRESAVLFQDLMPGIEFLHLPTRDHTEPSIENLQKGVEFMKRHITAGGKVYVHCHWGEGRGPSMVVAFLISEGMTVDDAMKTVTKVRTFVSLNARQLKQMVVFADLYHSKQS
jgi:hypothetical protein